MTVPQSNTTAEPSLGRDVLYAARYYLGNRWALVALGGFAAAAGLYFGGWGWLVAAGLAPIVLSTLPCLIMCAFGVCTMCRSNKTLSAAPLDTANAATLPAAPGTANIDQSTKSSLSCCHNTDRPKTQRPDGARVA